MTATAALTDCPWCARGEAPHQDWHPTRAQLLDIGRELSRRFSARERDAIRAMPDDVLVGFGLRLRRMLANASEDGLPDFLVDLAREWLADAEREWAWRRRAARNGADPVVRSTTWDERAAVVKRETDLALLIAYEAPHAEPAGRGKWRCTCPFHDDRHPSLDIDVAKGVWVCRACQVGGDAITYAELRYGLGFAEAVRHLEERLGIEPPVRQIHGVEIARPDGYS